VITFIIPNYDKPELTLQAVFSLYANTKNFRCIVVDDGSPSQEFLKTKLTMTFPQAEFVGLEKNAGFSTACNAGIKAAKGSHVVLFNNDCELKSDAVPILEKLFAGEDAPGIIGALLLYPDGKIQHDGMSYLPRVPGAFVHDAGATSRPSRYCVSVTGAFYAIRADVVEKVGLLDDSLFAACEDSDYCLRAWQAGFSVWYEKTLEAVHIEGATRGRTPGEKRERLGREKYAREMATIQAFRKKHDDTFMGLVDMKVKKLNTQKGLVTLPELKIELGGGANPQPGFVACDARKMPGVAHVFNFGAQRFPFKDGAAGAILMNHSIEHVSYRALPHVLKECHRVLAPGGRLIIRTPDLRFICEMYLKSEITPEWPGDENFIAANFGGDARKLSPAWWANVKLFAGQDYPGNEHRFCFDYETLKEVLARYGFGDVKRHFDKPVFSPGEIYCEAVRV
jgi:GT2 family glycosyltransferase/predicted SAM-dependent methyltransferase